MSKVLPNAVAYSCIIKQVTSFYTQVTKGIKKWNKAATRRAKNRIAKGNVTVTQFFGKCLSAC